ncbi:MAG TPA: CDP-diacylglycerol--serine O-phosphatidyltransferase [Bacteroidia bacterium]|jgi:CDP-diacylglycerol--serine O-phosphatidyltransferase|nr:CDP-diacylglycerol--serine O-phosphatidyltransferase [Bacteroidia bacterium]
MSFIRNNIPNAITCLNLLCGCMALVFISRDFTFIASWLVIGAAVADFFDGLAARLLNVKSPIGKDLDSLADMVSFGVVPGMMLVKLIHDPIFCWIGLAIPIFAALRLAKFNNDERQATNFIGLPSPANALFIISFPLIIRYHNYWQIFYLSHAEFSIYFFSAVAVICSALMVMPIPLFSMKMKNLSWANNKTRYIFAILSLIGLVLLAYQAVPLIMILYVVLSVIENTFSDSSIPA